MEMGEKVYVQRPVRLLITKRLIDIIFSSTFLIALTPLFVIIALAIKLTDRGPVIFRQKRVGQNGRIFDLYKFRTMRTDSDRILREYLDKNPEARKEWALYRKLRSYDPRITTIGRILRRFSLDETPQFVNVLKGDMSLVGPRPYLLEELEDHGVPEDVRKVLLSVKPGITGLWQVTHRNHATFSERIKTDLSYIEGMSLKEDFKILLKTIFVVIKGNGY